MIGSKKSESSTVGPVMISDDYLTDLYSSLMIVLDETISAGTLDWPDNWDLYYNVEVIDLTQMISGSETLTTYLMIAALTINIIPELSNNEPSEVVMAAENRDSEMWLCDTGSGRYICANRKYFINLHGRINELIFDAEYCPGLRFNIFSACKARRDLSLAYNDITFKLHDVFQ